MVMTLPKAIAVVVTLPEAVHCTRSNLQAIHATATLFSNSELNIGSGNLISFSQSQAQADRRNEQYDELHRRETYSGEVGNVGGGGQGLVAQHRPGAQLQLEALHTCRHMWLIHQCTL